MIKSILDVVHEKDKIILEHLHSKIGENPNIAWYPSAGDDFRDVIEAVTRTSIKADLFFHTDYHRKWVQLQTGEVFNDRVTIVTINKITELKFKRKVNYFVSPDYVDFPEDSYPRPKIYLLDVEIVCGHGIINKPVIYFFMENINFLVEVLLKFKISLSHLIKVREGCAWGGNRKSITIAYALLGELNVKHILVDNRTDVDHELIMTICAQNNLKPVKYKFTNARENRQIAEWSRFSVKILDLEIFPNELLTEDDFNNILEIIRRD
jgi:hypothetical protein